MRVAYRHECPITLRAVPPFYNWYHLVGTVSLTSLTCYQIRMNQFPLSVSLRRRASISHAYGRLLQRLVGLVYYCCWDLSLFVRSLWLIVTACDLCLSVWSLLWWCTNRAPVWSSSISLIFFCRRRINFNFLDHSLVLTNWPINSRLSLGFPYLVDYIPLPIVLVESSALAV